MISLTVEEVVENYGSMDYALSRVGDSSWGRRVNVFFLIDFHQTFVSLLSHNALLQSILMLLCTFLNNLMQFFITL